MAVSKNKYTTMNLEFAELQLSSYKNWLEANPYDKIDDRKELQLNKKTGGSFMTTVQTKEVIQKAHREATKDYLLLCEILEKLRAADAQQKKLARGGKDIPEAMEDIDG